MKIIMDWELLADQPLWKKLINKGFWLYFFTLFIWPAGYFIRVIISNNISVADVGIIYSILWFMWILAAYHDLGLTEALQYHLPKYRIQKKYNAFKTSIFLTLIIQGISWLVIGFLLFFWANYLSVNYFHSPESANIIKIFCLYFLGVNFFNMLYSIYIAFQDVVQYKLIEFIKSYITLGFTFCFFLLGSLNITTFTWAWIIGLWASLAISFIIFLRKYTYTLKKGEIERDRELIRKQMKYAFRVFIGINVAWLLWQLDQQFVIYFLWAQAAGYYTNYISLILSFSVITWPILGYIFPLTTELVEKGENEKIKQIKNIFYKYFSLFAISISWLFLVLGKEIATILFGAKFIYSWVLLQYSSIFLIFNVLFGINFWFLAGMGKVKERAKIIFITLITNIILNLIFIYIRWLIGVVAAMMISRVQLFYLSYRLINKEKKISFDRRYLIKNMIAIVILCIIMYSLKNKFFVLDDIYRYKNLLYLIAFFLCYYLSLVWFNIKSVLAIRKEINIIRKAK